MKINSVIINRFKAYKTTDLSRYSGTLVTFFIMLSAMISGSVFYFMSDIGLKDKIGEVFVHFNEQYMAKSKPEIFLGLLMWALLYLITMLLCSTSVIGTPFVYLINFIRISALSILISHMYWSYGLRGFEYSLLVLLPGKLFLLLSYLIITDVCIDITKNIRSVSEKYRSDVKNIFMRVIIGIIMTLLQIITDYSVLTLFSGLFEF